MSFSSSTARILQNFLVPSRLHYSSPSSVLASHTCSGSEGSWWDNCIDFLHPSMFLAHLLPPHPASLNYFREALLSSSDCVIQTRPQQQGQFLPPLPLLCLIPELVQFPLLILADWEGNAAKDWNHQLFLPWAACQCGLHLGLGCYLASPLQTLLGLIHPPISASKCFSLCITHVVPGRETVTKRKGQIRELDAQKWPLTGGAAKAA